MFESEDFHDVMDDFTAMGCNVNAFTSYNETVYFFSTTDKKIRKPLELLLDFVQNFTISEASVEKEKGIILSEYKMYQQMPETRLAMELLKSLYHRIPLNKDISGDEENIMAISKEELQLAHSINYNPANMVLVIVTDNDPKDVIAMIRENQKNKSFVIKEKISKVFAKEPEQVVRKEYEFSMDLTQPKIAVGYKFKAPKTDRRTILRYDLLARLWMYAYFSANNPDYQSWLDDKIINDSFNADIDISDEYALMMFACDDLNQGFAKLIDNYLHSLIQRPFDKNMLKQLKNRFIGKIIQDLNSIEDIAINTIRYGWWDTEYLEIIAIIEKFKVADFKELAKMFCFKNRAIVKIK